MTLLWLFYMWPTITLAVITNSLVNDTSKCNVTNRKFWDLMEWFYGRTSNVFVTHLAANPEDVMNHFYPDVFLKAILKRCNYTIIYNVLTPSYDEPFINYANTFSWQGEKFELRKDQTSHISFRSRRATTLDHLLPADHRADDHLPIREDETELAAFVMVETITELNHYLTGTARKPFLFPRRLYVLAIFKTDELDFSQIANIVLEKLWRDYGIVNTIMMTPCNNSPDLIGTYIPYTLNIINQTAMWGKSDWRHINNIDFHDSMLFKKLENLYGFPLKVSMFERYPTALRKEGIPSTFLKSYFMNTIEESKGYGGLDGIVMGNLAKAMNFTAITVTPQHNDFGYKLNNGSFVGSIGDVLYRNTYISFNARFTSDYGTDEIEYMFPVFCDKLCIIAPKALRIPEWMAIFKCFHISVWILFLIVTSLCGYVWFLLKQSNVRKMLIETRMKRMTISNRTYNKFSYIFIEMWIIMLAGPSSQLPFRTIERIFLTSCLLANLIFAGTFQGSLTTSFSTVSHYKDIDTLEELDKSGLTIGTTSASLSNIFGDDEHPLIQSLARKFKILSSNAPVIERAAFNRDICCVERFADIKVIIATHYELSDRTPLLHAIKECPRVYYVAYIVKKGWPLLPSFSHRIQQFFEGGLLNIWYAQVENAIITVTRYHRQMNEEPIQAFTLIDMQTAFYILGIGLFGCLCVFAGEIYYYKRYQRLRSWQKTKENVNNYHVQRAQQIKDHSIMNDKGAYNNTNNFKSFRIHLYDKQHEFHY